MKLEDARRIAGFDKFRVKIDENDQLPLGIIEDTEMGMGICTFDFNEEAKDAPPEMKAKAACMVHYTNKFPAVLDALREAMADGMESEYNEETESYSCIYCNSNLDTSEHDGPAPCSNPKCRAYKWRQIMVDAGEVEE